MDGRKPDGNRVGRITMNGEVTEFPIPSQTGSPINIAVGPDRNIWFTKGGVVGRVTPDGVDHRVSAADAEWRGDRSDRRQRSSAAARLSNRLWVAASGGNRSLFLTFK